MDPCDLISNWSSLTGSAIIGIVPPSCEVKPEVTPTFVMPCEVAFEGLWISLRVSRWCREFRYRFLMTSLEVLPVERRVLSKFLELLFSLSR
jgi:hypothetical protein